MRGAGHAAVGFGFLHPQDPATVVRSPHADGHADSRWRTFGSAGGTASDAVDAPVRSSAPFEIPGALLLKGGDAFGVIT